MQLLTAKQLISAKLLFSCQDLFGCQQRFSCSNIYDWTQGVYVGVIWVQMGPNKYLVRAKQLLTAKQGVTA